MPSRVLQSTPSAVADGGEAAKVDAVPHRPARDADPGSAHLGLHGPGAGHDQPRVAVAERFGAGRPSRPLVVQGDHDGQAGARKEADLLGVEQVGMSHVDSGRDQGGAEAVGARRGRAAFPREHHRVAGPGEGLAGGRAEDGQEGGHTLGGQRARQVESDALGAALLQARDDLGGAEPRVVGNVDRRGPDDARPSRVAQPEEPVCEVLGDQAAEVSGKRCFHPDAEGCGRGLALEITGGPPRPCLRRIAKHRAEGEERPSGCARRRRLEGADGPGAGTHEPHRTRAGAERVGESRHPARLPDREPPRFEGAPGPRGPPRGIAILAPDDRARRVCGHGVSKAGRRRP